MIVPGSILNINHPFSWYAIVKDRQGKQWTYWMNGNLLNREVVAAHIAKHYHAVEVITIDQCTGPPQKMLRPIPPSHYEFGIRENLERMIAGTERTSLRGQSLRGGSIRQESLRSRS